MGTALISQRKGRKSSVFNAPSHRFTANVVYPLPTPKEKEGAMRGEVLELVDDVGRCGILAKILLEDGRVIYNIAAEGQREGDLLSFGSKATVKPGAVLPLAAIPDGVPVYNVELTPGDGGKIARTSGSGAFVLSRDEETGLVSVVLASKSVKMLKPACRVTIGVPAGGGRLEKPLMKAGDAYYKTHARNRYWPIVRGTAMSAYDHPHGGKSFGCPTAVKRSAPPGQKTGHIAASRTGRKRGKRERGAAAGIEASKA